MPTQKYVFGDFEKKNNPLIWRFFVFKLCTTMAFMILLKPHVRKKSGFRVKCKNCSMFRHAQAYPKRLLRSQKEKEV